MDPTFKAEDVQISKDDIIKSIDEKKLICTINGCFYKPHDVEMSLYAQVLESLISSRKIYKNKKFEAESQKNVALEKFYDTKQQVYKVLANSLYGVIANKSFRFYDNSCAAAITLGGQEALKNSIIYSDCYMEKLNTGKDISPVPITKQEMFDSEMPNRTFKYIVTGDTDSIFLCFQKFTCDKSDEHIKELCDQIQTYLNDDIVAGIVMKHNVSNPKYNKLKLKNELIISRGLFLAKKRYAIHVVNNEGEVVDKMKYMGIEIKRSDYPSASKEFMKDIIDLIMKAKTVSLSNLFRFVETKEKEFRKLIKDGDKTIARPVSYGKELDEYKVVPQGVRAMETFNKIAYSIHTTGTRSYMFKVSGIDMDKAPDDIRKNYAKFLKDGNKLEVVAIPDDEPKLPDYFIPDVKEN